jgi:hypothetical protein
MEADWVFEEQNAFLSWYVPYSKISPCFACRVVVFTPEKFII